ncbi:MAG: succinylglutamate desuccinylase/aspartoacylase family protein [Longimonas sp.]|uniref:succinylglutamate desuccinylase/aspartoacylase family protein n=1 Tax=Longimonas sp. TaxID=2039626 RepID=UPI0039765339
MLEFGTAQAAPGEISTGMLNAGETRHGAAFGLPVAVVNGIDEGPTLYIQAGSDGDELNGLAVVRSVMQQINPGEMAGQVLVVGILNYHGFQRAEHRNPLDDTKLNRAFPGDPAGSSSERLAHLVYTQGVQHADLAIDLHQGGTKRMINEVRVRCGPAHPLHDKCLELARVFGTAYILDEKGPDGQLARAAPDDGIPLIDPELGGTVGWDDASIEVGVQGVLNVLAHYGFTHGEPTYPTKQVRATGFEEVYASRGGLIDLAVDLGDRVETGDRLFAVTDVFGTVKEVVEAPTRGIVWRMRRLPMVATGEQVMKIGTGVEFL